MKHFIIILFILKSTIIFGQKDSALLNHEFKFKDGIYTRNTEVLMNAPKYSINDLVARVDVLLGKMRFYYLGESSEREPLADSVFAYVEQGMLRVYYKNQFYKLILKGPVSTFYTETTVTYASGYTDKNDKLYFVDLETGKIDRLTPDNIDFVIKRDANLYSKFSDLSESQKRKTLYSYILKYNQNNPIYIKTIY